MCAIPDFSVSPSLSSLQTSTNPEVIVLLSAILGPWIVIGVTAETESLRGRGRGTCQRELRGWKDSRQVGELRTYARLPLLVSVVSLDTSVLILVRQV